MKKILHPFNDLFSRTTWVSHYQKGKTSLDLNDARGFGMQWHQQWRINHDANNAMAWGPPLKGAPEQLSDFNSQCNIINMFTVLVL